MGRRRSGEGEQGVTLLETGVIVAVLALLAGLAVASVRGFIGQKTVAGWTESIINDIRSAQQLSIAERAGATVTFTSGTPATYTTAIGGTTLRRQTLPPELTVTAGTIQYSSLGIPSAGAAFTLTDARNGQTLTITVAPVTGAVTAQ
jgi:type II secretory pathway pseudopilin PulG